MPDDKNEEGPEGGKPSEPSTSQHNDSTSVVPADDSAKWQLVFADISEEERHPDILGVRLSWEAYVVRCRNLDLEPCPRRYSDHLDRTPEQMAQIDAELASRKTVLSRDEFRRFFVVRDYGSKPRVCHMRGGELQTQSFDDFCSGWNDLQELIHTPDGPKMIPAAKHWLRTHARRFVRADFLPLKQAPREVFNLWAGLPPGLIANETFYEITGALYRQHADDPGYRITGCRDADFDGEEMPQGFCDRFIDHLFYVVCNGNEEVYRYFLGWWADALWNPGPTDVAIVLRGARGTGKTFPVERMMELFDPYTMTLDDPEDLLGKFNSHLQNKLVLFAEEAFFAGNPRHAAKLKSLISGPTINVEPKGVNKFRVKKWFRLVMASNDDHVISAAVDERRFLALHVEDHANKQNRAHFRAMQEEWDATGKAAMLKWLSGDYWRRMVADDAFRLRAPPGTDELAKQKLESLTPGQQFILAILEDAEVGAERPALRRVRDGEFLGRGRAPKPYGLYEVMRQRVPKLRELSEHALAKVLTDWGAEKRVSNGQSVWTLPPLGEMRRAWDDRMGPYPWRDERKAWLDDERAALDEQQPF